MLHLCIISLDYSGRRWQQGVVLIWRRPKEHQVSHHIPSPCEWDSRGVLPAGLSPDRLGLQSHLSESLWKNTFMACNIFNSVRYSSSTVKWPRHSFWNIRYTRLGPLYRLCDAYLFSVEATSANQTFWLLGHPPCLEFKIKILLYEELWKNCIGTVWWEFRMDQ